MQRVYAAIMNLVKATYWLILILFVALTIPLLLLWHNQQDMKRHLQELSEQIQVLQQAIFNKAPE